MNQQWRNNKMIIRRKISDTYMINSMYSPIGHRSQLDVVITKKMGSVTVPPPLQSNLQTEEPQLKSDEPPVKILVGVAHIQAGTYQNARNSLLGVDSTHHQLTFRER